MSAKQFAVKLRLARRGTDLRGHTACIRVVRMRDGFWAAPVHGGTVSTVYFVPTERLDAWAYRQLRNPQERARLHKLPLFRSRREAVTDELTALWLA